jgi:hypothetical protein
MTQLKSEITTMTLTEPIQPVLDKRIPAALVAALLFQIAGIIYWAGTAAERLSVLESNAVQNQTAIERIAVLENEIATMRVQVGRIEAKLDRIQEPRSTR